MTTRSRATRGGWWRFFLAALAALVVGLLGAGTASAIALPNPESRVGASNPVTAYVVGPHECITAGQRWVNAPPQAETVAGRGVATNAVPETLSFGSRAAAREGLPGDLAAAGNRFFRGATSKSHDFKATRLPDGGYRMEFFSPANNPGYGKLYVQEIDRTGQVLREYKNTIGPDGLIETKWVHGGP